MLLFYEGGMLLLGPQALRNGADVWLRQLLSAIGFGQYFLLPLMTCAGLLAWHHTTRQRWQFSPRVLHGMLLESAVLGFFLLIIAGSFSRSLATAIPCGIPSQATLNINRLVGYVGAGLYEELLFRLMLLPSSAYLLRLLGLNRKMSLMIAAILTSAIFSAAHYELFTSYGDVFQWYTFSFRIMAGLFFSVLFIYRGFGIAAGVHALYDIFTLF